MAANARNKVAIVDTKEGKLAAMVGRRAPRHILAVVPISTPGMGPVWATGHLGSEHLLIGADPDKHPQQAWKVVKELQGQGGGSLFVKTHPNTPNLYVDTTLNPEPEIAASVAVFDIENLDEARGTRCCRSASGRASPGPAPRRPGGV